MTGIGTATDQLALHALVADYADAVNVADADRWGATWAEDATWDLGAGRHFEGRSAIVEGWLGAMASFDEVIQIVGHGSVEVSGVTASGRWTLFEVDRRDGETLFVVGCYRDRYRHQDGRWWFTERAFTVTYRSTLPAGAFSPFPPLA